VTQFGWLAVGPSPGERDHGLDAELARELDRAAERLVRPPREVGVRMEWVAVAGEGADLEPARLDLGLEVRRIVRVARIVARPDLDGVETERDDAVERLWQRQLAEDDREDAELHAVTPANDGMTSSP
jgi:hypothetical protein